MHGTIDLERYPIHMPKSEAYRALVAHCRETLASEGLFNLPGFVRSEALEGTVEIVAPRLVSEAFTHARRHNIYFRQSVDGLADDHPALKLFDTVNHTLCADQLGGTMLPDLHAWPPFISFLAQVMGKECLFAMEDPLASINVMGYGENEALNWHFDRSEFTTTLLLQAPEQGGAFEYATDLRSDDDPNYEGVARLIEGREPTIVMPLAAGTLNVFRGKNTAHRVTPVAGAKQRIIAVFSYYDRPGVQFSDEERIGFYGRAA